MIKLTGLWKTTSKKGEPYLQGSISPSSNLLVLPNKYKEKDKDPDFIAYIVQPSKQKDSEEAEPKKEDSFL